MSNNPPHLGPQNLTMSSDEESMDGTDSEGELSDDFDAEDDDLSSENGTEVTIETQKTNHRQVGFKRVHPNSNGDEAVKKAKINKAPTADEISQLKETENLFQSSIFRMQVCYNCILTQIWLIVGN